MSGTIGNCKYCGQQIVWIKTLKKKMMPCDPHLVPFYGDEEGKERIVKADGSVVRCSLEASAHAADGYGYIPHFSTCPNYDKHPGKKARKENSRG